MEYYTRINNEKRIGEKFYMDLASINFLQIFFNGLITGSIYFLAALGLSLTYSLLNFPNISHAEFLAFGAYVAYIFLEFIEINFFIAIIIAFFFTGLLGIFSYLIVFKPLYKKGSKSMHLAIASLGYGLFLRYSMYQIHGRETLTYKIWFEAFNIGPIRLTSLWILTILTSLILVFILHLFLKKTLIGKAMRALSNNPTLAIICGIDKEKILLLVWFIGAGLAGIGGVFRAGDTRITPILGWDLMIPIFAVIILGGIKNLYAIIASSYIIGLIENFSIILLTIFNLSTEYKVIIAFIILIAILLFKPYGLITKTENRGK